MKINVLTCRLLLGASCFVPVTLHAADGTWNVDSDGNWSDTGNWDSGTVADGTDFTATFDDVITADRTVTLDTVRTIGNITFSDTSHHLTISADNTLTLDNTGGKPSIDVVDEELTIPGVIAGTTGLEKVGNGLLNLNGSNTFSGGVDLAAGVIRMQSATNDASLLGVAGNTLTFTGNATLRTQADGQYDLPQNITINGGVTGTLAGAFGERIFVGGVLAGSGTLVVDGGSAGFHVHCQSGIDTFTGPVEILGNSGHGYLRVANLVDSANTITLGRANGTNSAGYLEYTSGATAPLVLNSRQFVVQDRWTNTTSDRITGIRNNAATANTITVNTDLLVTSSNNALIGFGGGNTGDNTFAGAIPDVGGGGTLGVVKRGGGKWILSGANTYEGNTTIVNGTLEIGGAGQLGGGTYAGNISNTDGSPSPFIVNSSASNTFSGVISGDAELIKDGAGTLFLTNANTYTGDTTVDGGTLSLGDGTNSSELDDFSTLSAATGAVLDLNYVGTDTVLSLNLGGSAAAAGTWGATGSGAANIDNTFFTGTGVINNLGGDTSALGVAFWDGGDVDIVTDGDASSGGGNGTWDATILNWDSGTVAHVAWPDTTASTAIFGGSTGTVTLDADMNIGTMNIIVPNGGGSGYNIGDTAEDNTLTFGGAATINVTATGSGSRNDHRIRAGIAGAPTINVIKRNNNGAFFALEPPAGVTQNVGTLNMDNSVLGSNSQLRLGGASSGNVVDQVTWTGGNGGHQMQLRKQGTGGPDATDWTVTQDIKLHGSVGGNNGRIIVDEGTLTFSGTDNTISHSIEVEDGGRMVVQGNWRIHDENEDFRVKSGGIVAPGASVGTATFNWNSSRGNPAVGLVDLQAGSTYEWEVGAGSTDTIALTEPVANGEAQLVVASGSTLEVIDAGGSPSVSDQLTVFTYDPGVVTPDTATLNANMTIDLSGTTWTGTPSFVNDGAGTIYVTGISSGGAPSPYDSWESANSLVGGPGVDEEGDGLVNLLEFGFGTDPNVFDNASLNPDGSVNGTPIAQASGGGGGVTFDYVFVRRDDHGTSGSVSYTVQFSGDLVTFHNSGVAPTFVADSTDDPAYEVVSIPYPAVLPDLKKARFARVLVEQVP